MSVPGPTPQSLTTTSLTPGDTATNLGPDLTIVQYSTIDQALSSYTNIRSQYYRLIDAAIQEQDPATRTQLMSTIEATNQQLSTIVASIQQMYNSGQRALSIDQPNTIQQDIEKYKEQLSDLRSQKDEVTKLKMLYASMNPSVATQSYYFYIVSILVMLIIILLLFTFSSLSKSVMPTTITTPVMPGSLAV